MSLRKDVGTLLIVGLGGPALTKVESAWLRLLQPSGIILFRRNIDEAAQAHALLVEAASLVEATLFRCVDVEGGLVDRLRNLVSPMPSAAAVAAAHSSKRAMEHGRLIGEEVALLGLNTTFAPVLDLALPASASVLKTRAPASTAEAVVSYASAFLAGLKKAGVHGCGKHFPGLGAGTLDSHTDMPEIDRGWQQLWEEDMLPYRRLRGKLPFIMVSHAAYPRVKQAHGPASLSKYWMTDILKKKIGYGGLVLSDDMEMGGALKQQSLAEACIAAVAAGAHLVEICMDPALVLQGYEALLSEAERSSAFARIVKRAAAHVKQQKRRLLRRDKLAAAPTSATVQAMRERIEAFAGSLPSLAGAGRRQ